MNKRILDHDITKMFASLREEHDNFSGHYENNLYNGINIFGNGIELGYFENQKNALTHAKESPIAVAIAELCRLADVFSVSFDNDGDGTDAHCRTQIRKIGAPIWALSDAGIFTRWPEIEHALHAANEDPIEFSKSILVVYNLHIRQSLNTQ